MKIEWVLEDPRYCNGCPCLQERGGHYYQHSCGLGWPVPDDMEMPAGFRGETRPRVVRPEACRRRNGD